MARHRRDTYYWRAKAEGYRSRAAYKLQQINKKFNVIREDSDVVDLGAAPGGWLEVARELTKRKVVGVDILRIKPMDRITIIRGDITREETVSQIKEAVGEDGADAVICDAAPNLSGNWNLDHARSIALAESALECATRILKPQGNFVVKVFQGDMFKEYLDKVRGEFTYVRAHSPEASRSESAEIYVVGKKFLTAPIRKGEEYDVVIERMGSGGDGTAFVEGFVVFICDTEKGEKVRIKVRDVKPNFAFADVIQRLESPEEEEK
ncbi:23S rRNA (uridine(2552)-2'-O)-methyltransferase [Methanohalophilus mahii]|uniref:Ribosomal RNA large subunit methyltransferase E n=1 Tax=Methanohalophilus mahii (strain ATCC 35705 / DSM 5219 / SLP) TaxID=547558 RepID=D5EA39_METMS|nr:23S rRNA (uridine(2552)-2'-O)-methyltransferase [Methanohalophilus mahii]ADE36040.1 23S rRNA Um-2552 2'-O-methyltransferase [Methanohalophilus mahii DSM 5219]